jgi:hypothetical protein
LRWLRETHLGDLDVSLEDGEPVLFYKLEQLERPHVGHNFEAGEGLSSNKGSGRRAG